MIQSTWVRGGPIDTSYSVTRSGWMEDYVLEAWFKTRFVKWLDTNNVQRPVMLIFDGHGSHITYQMAQIAKEMEFVCFVYLLILVVNYSPLM